MKNQVQHCLEDRDFSPYLKFMYALIAPESKRQYPRRLQVFLDFIHIDRLTVEEKTNHLYLMITENGREWLENQLIKFFASQNQRVERNEISAQTINNYFVTNQNGSDKITNAKSLIEHVENVLKGIDYFRNAPSGIYIQN